MGHHVDQRLSGNKSLPLSVQHFCRNDVGEGPAHERATLARSLELIRRNREKELNKVAIQVRIPSLTQNLRRPDTGSDLPPQGFHCSQPFLEARSGWKQRESVLALREGSTVCRNEAGIPPRCGANIPDGSAPRQEGPQGFAQQSKNSRSVADCPSSKLFEEQYRSTRYQ